MTLFESEEYLRDKNKFFFLDEFRNLESSKFVTDGKTFAMNKTNEGCPTWVWTKDDLSDEEYSKVAAYLYDYLEEDETKFTSKEEFYKYLVRVKHELLVDVEPFIMGYLYAKELVKPKKCEGYFRLATLDDLDVLLKFHFDLFEEEGSPLDTYEVAKEKTSKFVNDKLVYLWVDNAGKVVSQVDYKVYGNRAKVAGVYTPKEERRKGYCSNTVYELTKLLLEKGYEVLLYTDYNYPNSNECYKKLGYEDGGYLVNYSLKRR